MLKILFIAIGRILGTILRSFMAHNIALSMSFNILLINYLGSFLAGEYKTVIWYIIIGNIGAVAATLAGIFLVKHLMFFIKS